MSKFERCGFRVSEPRTCLTVSDARFNGRARVGTGCHVLGLGALLFGRA